MAQFSRSEIEVGDVKKDVFQNEKVITKITTFGAQTIFECDHGNSASFILWNDETITITKKG